MKDLIELITSGLEPSSDEEIEQARLETLQQLKEDLEDQPWEDVEAVTASIRLCTPSSSIWTAWNGTSLPIRR
jgi:hypothetical protein